jgi:hypothetical protein
MKPEKKPYRIFKDTTGCKCCGSGTMWGVIGPGEVQLATSYANKEDAEFMREMCNYAYSQGYDKGCKKDSEVPWNIRGYKKGDTLIQLGRKVRFDGKRWRKV